MNIKKLESLESDTRRIYADKIISNLSFNDNDSLERLFEAIRNEMDTRDCSLNVILKFYAIPTRI
jgi:hypothetical protein